jgi:protein tyrosine phosphatase (PTP) superfamily phosphohydrolase (DUF442 family)
MPRPVQLVLIAATAWTSLGCGNPATTPPSSQLQTNVTTEAAWTPERIECQFLPNALRLNEKVLSGGQPAGEPAFAELAALGVKTVISVDGAKPDVELARRHGLRYVQLPHGYDGVPEERARELAKAVRDLPGPIYIHCHHGKHRSPSAATVACVGAGLLGKNDALAVLKTAGTAENYRGLYESAEQARRFEDAVLDALEAEYPETAKLPAMAEAMVAVEHHFDHLQAIAQAGWQPPADHPDLDPSHEALLLREQFTELLRTEHVKAQPQRFQDLTAEGESAAQLLEDALRGGDDQESTTAAFALVTKNCKTCHQEFRDVPLSEKQPH